jgi:acyl-CoA reductase-like NAD-dependent aldehyde dehydrogenase
MAYQKIDFNGPYLLNINNELVDSPNEKIKVYNPVNNQVIGEAPSATREQTEAAIAAAKAAFPAWSGLSWDEREKYLVAFSDAIAEHREEFKELLCKEQGKPFHHDHNICVDFTIDWIKDYAKLRLEPNVIFDDDMHKVVVEHVPIGVVGMIMPWNFPFLLALWQIAPCLLAGCPVVLKPSSFTPLTSLRFGEIAAQIFPAGVLNVLSGKGSEVGDVLGTSVDIAKIAFTGSIATGKKLMEQAGATVKRLTLEMGGNDACIVLDDADIEKVIPQIAWAALGNTGQWCIAIKRIYCHEKIYDEFLKALVDFVSKLKMGDGMLPETDLAPINNKRQYNKLLDMIDDIKKNGYTIAYEATPDPDWDPNGNWIPVMVIDNPPEDSRIVQEEQFGPIIPVMKWNDLDDVIEKANATRFGLGGSVWGEDRERAEAVARRVRTGNVWVNEIHIHHIAVPFGGIKESGLGVENGIIGLEEYCDSVTYFFAK